MKKAMYNKKDFKEFKQAAGLSSQPFYLKKPKDNVRAIVVAGLMIIVMCFASPYLLIVIPFYLIWAFYNLKRFKSEANVLLGEAINYYESQRYDDCLEILNKVLKLEPENEKARIISSLIEYERESYENVIQLLSTIKPEILDKDIDLQIKLADSFIKLGKNENAKGLYKKLSKITGNSDFIKDAMSNLEDKF